MPQGRHVQGGAVLQGLLLENAVDQGQGIRVHPGKYLFCWRWFHEIVDLNSSSLILVELRLFTKDNTEVYFLFRDRSDDDLRNPGNNLFVTGLSTRVTEAELEKFFSKEGKVWCWFHCFTCYLLVMFPNLSDYLFIMWNLFWQVKNCHVVLDPRSKESRGFAFVSMDTVEDARRCIKRLHRTVLEGRLVTVEKVRYHRVHTYWNENTLFLSWTHSFWAV